MTDPHAARRASRFRLAVGTSVASKIVGALAQILTLPLALAGLGEARFAAFVAITALVQWAAPLQLGVLPSLTRELADATARGDRHAERSMVGAGIWFCLAIGVFLLALSLGAAAMFSVREMVGAEGDVGGGELRWGFIAAASVMSLQLFASVSTALRAGYQESWVSNLLAFAANVIVVAATFAVQRAGGSIAGFVLAIYAPMSVLLLGDCVAILWRRRHLLPLEPFRMSEVVGGKLRAFGKLSAVAWVAQLHYMATVFGTTVVMSHLHGPGETGAFGAMMRAMVLGNSAIGLLSWPLVPAVTDAVARGDHAWARRAALRMLGLTLAAAAVGGLVIALFGPELLRLWMGPQLVVPRPMAWGFGLYFTGWSMTFVAFNLCVSLSATRRIPLILLCEVVVLVGLIALLHPLAGASSVALALGLSSVLVSGWLLPRRVLMAVGGVRRGRASHAA